MQRTDTPPAAVIESAPQPARADLARLDSAIAEVMAGSSRWVWEGVFWGGSQQRIIGYGDHRYVNRSGRTVEWFIVGLAAQKQYLSLYVNATEDGEYLVKRYAPRLGEVKVGSANVTFRRLQDVDLDVLLEMVARARDLLAGAEA